MKLKLVLALLITLITTAPSHAAETIVAVAANFTEPVKEIAANFTAETGYNVTLSFGATGNFFNQIKNGAPFEVFLAADSERPTKAVNEGYAVKGTQFTYAIGTLVLWSTKPDVVRGAATLANPDIKTIAYCNPDAAPYGKAAVETLDHLKLTAKLKPKLVEGQNISQAYQYVKTGNAEIGFVALSQVINDKEGSHWVVPQSDYNPIKQDAVLLKKGENNPVAQQFLDYIRGPKAQAIIKKYGYRVKIAT